MAAWTSLSTGSPCTQTCISILSPVHHSIHVKRGVVRCLYDRARRIINMQDKLQKEVYHLARVLKQNDYPANFIHNASAPLTQETADTSSHDKEQEEEREPLVVISHVAGMSEDIRCVCRFNSRVVFKSGWTLHSNVDQGQGYITSW